MPTMLQIRNLPDALHRALKVRAAEEGVSMSDWVTARIAEALERPSHHALMERIAARPSTDYGVDVVELIRGDRGAVAPALAADSSAPYTGSQGTASSGTDE